LDFAFEPLGPSDLPLLAGWLARPHVRRWWGEASDPASVEARYGPLLDGSDPSEGFVVHLGGRPIGYAQRYLCEEDPDWRAAIGSALGDPGGIGIDYLIGEPDLLHRGVGRRMIASFVDECWRRHPSQDRVVVAVQQGNVASWKALEAAGFRRAWAGGLETSDPSDQGPSYVYVTARGAA